jgi:hypothetical protein
MLNQRRKLLAYLRRDNFPRYAFVLHKLGLKDTYAKQVGKDSSTMRLCSYKKQQTTADGQARCKTFGRLAMSWLSQCLQAHDAHLHLVW